MLHYIQRAVKTQCCVYSADCGFNIADTKPMALKSMKALKKDPPHTHIHPLADASYFTAHFPSNTPAGGSCYEPPFPRNCNWCPRLVSNSFSFTECMMVLLFYCQERRERCGSAVRDTNKTHARSMSLLLWRARALWKVSHARKLLKGKSDSFQGHSGTC